MAKERPKRNRGVQLTAIGYDRFLKAKAALEETENDGDRFTLEDLHERTGLAVGTLTRILNREGVVDKRTLSIAFHAIGLSLTAEDYAKPAATPSTSPASTSVTTTEVRTAVSTPRYDWGSAVDVSRFQHRQTELQTLAQWMHQDQCRLVAILGLGGMGKTYLSVKAGQQIQEQFDRVLWRSLRHRPTFDRLLEDMVVFLTGRPAPRADLNQLETAIQTERCLIILDNLESILQPDQRAGIWQPGYEGYGELLKLFGETAHQSCLLFTSREKPTELAAMASNPTIQALTLQGCHQVALAILQASGLKGEASQFHQLCQQYDGLPLALVMTAALIQDVFDGNVGLFLAQDPGLISDLQHLIESQFSRLNPVEQAIAYWLAINRDSTTLADLEQDLIPKVARDHLLGSLESLHRRSLIESQQEAFTLQSVIMTHISDRIVREAYTVLTQFSSDTPVLGSCLHTHALLKGQATDLVQAAQKAQLVQPLLERLLKNSNRTHLIARLKRLLPMSGAENTYWSGNLMTLLIQLQADLSGQSFADLTLWQVDFRGVNLAQTSFRRADLSRCRFSHTFGPVYTLVFSPDGKTLVTGHGDGMLQQWTLDGHLHRQYAHATPISTLAYSPDGDILAVGTFDGSVHLYNGRAELQPLRSQHPHNDWIQNLVFLPDNGIASENRIASGSHDGVIQVWECHTEAVQQILELGPVTALSVSQDGWLVSSDENGTLQLWQVDSSDEPWQEQHNSSLVTAAISADSALVASADTQQLQIWQRQGQALHPLWQTPLTTSWALAFSPKDYTLAVTDGANIQLFDAATSLPLHTLSGHTNPVWSLAFDPTGTLLASGSDDQITLWDVSSGQIWRTWKTADISDSPILSAVFSQDGQYLVSGNGQGEVRLWNCQTGQCMGMMSNHCQSVRSLALDPQTQYIASGSDNGTVRLWNRQTHTEMALMQHSQSITALAISLDGHGLASGSADGTLRLWDLHRNQLQASLSGHEGRVLAIAFSPDGNRLATSSSDYTIRIWALPQSTPQIVLKGHQGWIWSIAFSPDGQWLASSSDDHTVKLWDIQQQTCIQTFQGHQKLVWSVAFWTDAEAETQRLVSSSLDQTIIVWNLDTAQPLDILEATTDLLWAIQPMGSELAIAGTQGNTLQLWNFTKKARGACLAPQSPYADMDITQAQGLAPATVNSLVRLGAIATAPS